MKTQGAHFVNSYEDKIEETKLRRFQREVFSQFPHHGFTLNLGSGTGVVGMLIRQSPLNSSSANSKVVPGGTSIQSKVYVHGIDVSTRMLSTPWCVRYYEEEALLYHSPHFGVDVRGFLVRFERVD